MTVPNLHLISETTPAAEVDILVLGVISSESGPTLVMANPGTGKAALGRAELAKIQDSLTSIGITGVRDEVYRIPSPHPSPRSGPRSLGLVGLGTAPVSSDALRYAAGSATRQLRGIESLEFALPTETAAEVLAVLEGAALGAYQYTDYRSSSLASTKLTATSITVLSSVAPVSDVVRRASIVAEAVHSVRDLVNTPPSDLYPETFAAAVVKLASDVTVEVTVLADQELRDGGFGGILAVGQGSVRGPRLVKISYSPATAAKHLALVGKGITFDSGGLSLKPATSMVGMKYDMTGAATAMAVVLAAAKLGLNIRMTAWLCIAENLPSGSAVRPNDVLRIRGGKTVEVLNTDAEGRLVLADGLVAASEEFPDAIVDIATLTGAARVALGERYAAAMGDEALVGQLIDAAKDVGELFWPMPLPDDLRAALNSDVADIANVRIGNPAAGMLVAGVFLKEFVGIKKDDTGFQIPWAHLDIAGTANNSGSGYGHTGKGPTGIAVRTLLALAEDISLA